MTIYARKVSDMLSRYNIEATQGNVLTVKPVTKTGRITVQVLLPNKPDNRAGLITE